MSSFQIDGKTVTGDVQPKDGLREQIRREVREFLSDPLGFPEEFKGWLPEYLALTGFNIPISQVRGFSQFTFNVASRVNTSQGVTSTSYTDLATVGPQLTGLPDGQYFIVFGCNGQSGALRDLSMSVKINAVEASDDDRAFIQDTTAMSTLVAVTQKTLAGGGNNTITARYKTSSGANVNVSNRWLAALKFSN